MKDEVRGPLHDIREAASAVKQFISGRTYEDYAGDELLRSGVERKFEIMGEALNRIRRDEPDLLGKIRDHRDIISFRNILVHGYDTIDDRIVWVSSRRIWTGSSRMWAGSLNKAGSRRVTSQTRGVFPRLASAPRPTPTPCAWENQGNAAVKSA